MTYILLTGAGFSRNWGGMLAPEVFQYLLGCSELDEELRRLLLRDRSFEDVLATLQRAPDSDRLLRWGAQWETTRQVTTALGTRETLDLADC